MRPNSRSPRHRTLPGRYPRRPAAAPDGGPPGPGQSLMPPARPRAASPDDWFLVGTLAHRARSLPKFPNLPLVHRRGRASP